jgi:ATP-dependent Clp protease ATP-binding subunit ClpA
MGELPYTSRAKKALEYTLSEARELGHDHTGAEHILLGLLREEKGIAAEVLNTVGVTLDRARRQILAQPVSPPEGTEAGSPVGPPYDEVIVVHLTNGETHRVLEKHGRSAREFAEAIGRRGVWITGQETFFVPLTAIARIQVYSPEEWERLGL